MTFFTPVIQSETFNFSRGIPYISKDREIRVRAIGRELDSGKYDIVSLQEVWSEADYFSLHEATKETFPYHHYFHSGVLGSGLCIFSKYPIERTFYHSWRLNGYVHRVYHGDWFGGKGVGLTRLNINGRPVNFYVTHLHAEYNRDCDDYQTHRVIQAFDTAQFIENTRGDSVLQILAGDLNTEPGDLAYRLIVSTAKLTDGYQTNLFGTCDCSKNSYTLAQEVAKNPNGKRIDYILFRAGNGWKVSSAKYELPLPNRVPGYDCSYSDHEAVLCRISITETVGDADIQALKKIEDEYSDKNRAALRGGIKTCNESLEALVSHRRSYWAAAIAVIVILLNVAEVQAPYGLKTGFLLLKILFTAAVIFFIFMATLWNTIERHGILSGKLSMEILLRSIEKV